MSHLLRNGIHRISLLLLAPAFLAAATAMTTMTAMTATTALAATDGPTPRIGTNLEPINDWGTTLPFNDLFKTSRRWISGNAATFQWDDARPLDLDGDGWVRSLLPNQIARTLMVVDNVTLRVGSGRHVVLYDGQGVISYSGSTTLVSRTPGRDVIDVGASANGGLFLFITATTPSNYLRNIRVIPEALANGTPTLFSAAFLARLEPYGVLRFMDWGRTNETTLANWADRPLLTDARWSEQNGVPLEVMIDLANETCSEPWFCIPHRATDDYVRQAARLIHERLAPGLRVWVEHSNETWNGIFPQAAYVQQQGLAAGLSTNSWQAGWFWHSRRSVRIFDIFKEEMGAARPLQRVMGGFVTVPWGNEQALAFEGAASKTDVLAIAPYFGHEWGTDRVQEARAMTPLQLVQAMRTQSLPATLSLVTQNRTLATGFGVELVAYEGGHHLSAPQLPASDPVHGIFHAAVRTPEMGDLYADYLSAWSDSGAGTFVNFSLCGAFSQWGCWSVIEWITQPPTPRELALIAHAKGQWMPACEVACSGDLDGDGAVGPADLATLLSSWGATGSGLNADLNRDGVVGAPDLAQMLGVWGACR